MAEYQQMKLAGHFAAGHASGPNPKSATEHGSSPQNRAQTGMRENAGHRKMAEYQHMKLAGHSAAGHVSGLNPKSAAEHESSPQKQNGTHTCKASDLKKAGIPRESPAE